MNPNYMTVDDIAKDLEGIFSKRHVAERIVLSRDFPPAIRIGKRRVYPREDYLQWLESRKEKK